MPVCLAACVVAARFAASALGRLPDDFVDVRRAVPDVRIELRYGMARNGVGQSIYPRNARCWLRRAVAARLARVQKRLERRGLGLKIWDGYRPPSAQRSLWRAKPDRRFVAPPQKGSRHSRGAAVDLTLVDSEGQELAMPCDFDTFDRRSRPTYSGGTRDQRANRDLLRRVMESEGFIPDRNEWWHFNAPDWRRYPVIDVPLRRPNR